MAYVAVSGGQEAIAESLRLLKFFRTSSGTTIEIQMIKDNLKLLIDRVMSEAGFYMPEYAALCLKQSEGSLEEAVFLLRAYRSTLQRKHYAHVLDGNKMRVIRRISAAFKDIEGGQILGPSYDYTHRLIDFSLLEETVDEINQFHQNYHGVEPCEDFECPRLSDELKATGILKHEPNLNSSVEDVTQKLLRFPVSRSAKLQTLTRADGGYLSGLAYSSLRGFGSVHPTVGELRTGYLAVEVPYPFNGEETIWVGEILVTEVESLVPSWQEKGNGEKELVLDSGYGAVFGRNENKAIAMSILDKTLDTEGVAPANNAEFTLIHGDSLEMNGFISHLKLPHYVTFQSKLDRVRSGRKEVRDGDQ